MRAMPRFCLLLLGIAVIFAANNTVNNFLINVMQNLRGNYADLGRLSFFSAVIEFPAMLAYSRVSTKMRKRCLRLSLLFFPIKLSAWQAVCPRCLRHTFSTVFRLACIPLR